MDLALDSNGDIYASQGEIVTVKGTAAILQHLKIRLRTFLGEWFLDETVGVPYFTEVFKKNPDLTVLNTIYTRTITDTPGVVSLNSLSFEILPTRELVVVFNATTVDGDIDYRAYVGV